MSYAIQERAVSTNPDAGPQGKGWNEEIAFTLEARNKVQAVVITGTPVSQAATATRLVAANDNYTGLTYLSVCSGIEAASVAWHPLGWRAVAYSEIEKFPSAVLKHHYPEVPNLGDFTKIDVHTLGRVDILAGGTPCQAFSVAGLRQSLADARGNLSLKFVRLAHELSDHNGLRNVVWENVVGVLSTKDNAFGCFLAGLVGADSPIEPPRRGKWGGAGMVSGPKGTAAWRVLDAQYFGVAQRRRRVIVVADFGNGADPAAVLFEQDGLRRYSPPSREKGKDLAADVAPSLISSGRGVARGGDTRGQDPVVAVLRGHSDYGDGAPTLRAKVGDCAGGSEALVFAAEVAPTIRAGGNKTGGDRPPGTDADTADSLIAYAPEIARCDATREGSSQDYETTTMVAVAGAICKDSFTGGAGGRPEGAAAGHFLAVSITGEVAHTLKAEGADASEDGTGRGTPIVCIHADAIGRSGEAVSPSADAAGVVRLRHPGMGINDNGTSYNLMASGQAHAVAFGGQMSMPQVDFELSQTLQAKNPQAVATSTAVRRLTPVECERLQGFPERYTEIPWRSKPADQCPDGPRYKALGNSWAVPKFAWLGKRLSALLAANDNRKTSNLERAA